MINQVNCDILYVNGDSWTYGSELIDPSSQEENHFADVHRNYRKTHQWARLLGNELGLKVINGSEAGAGNDRILRTTINNVSNLLAQGKKPFVVISWTQLHRFELCSSGGVWRSFVSPNEGDTPSCVLDIWKQFNSDYIDVAKWMQQVLLLDGFLKLNQVPYISTTVFKDIFWLYQKHGIVNDLAPLRSQLVKHFDFTKHFLHHSMDSVLMQFTDITYGPGGHPLELGQQRLMQNYKREIDLRYQF